MVLPGLYTNEATAGPGQPERRGNQVEAVQKPEKDHYRKGGYLASREPIDQRGKFVSTSVGSEGRKKTNHKTGE